MCYSLEQCVLNVRIRTKLKNTDTLFVASKISLQTNVEKSKYMFMPREQNSEQKDAVNLSHKSSENGAKSKLMGKTLKKSKVYAFLWVIPRRLNCICRRFGTLCSIFTGG